MNERTDIGALLITVRLFFVIMYLKRLLWALAAPLFFVSCSEKETPDTEPEVKIDFAVTSVSVPAGTSSELALTVDPSEKASLVSVSIADEEVASITGTRG